MSSASAEGLPRVHKSPQGCVYDTFCEANLCFRDASLRLDFGDIGRGSGGHEAPVHIE